MGPQFSIDFWRENTYNGMFGIKWVSQTGEWLGAP
jgi:hypothetical protein